MSLPVYNGYYKLSKVGLYLAQVCMSFIFIPSAAAAKRESACVEAGVIPVHNFQDAPDKGDKTEISVSYNALCGQTCFTSLITFNTGN